MKRIHCIKILIGILVATPLITRGQDGCKISRKACIEFINWKINSDNESKKFYEIKRVNKNPIPWDSLDLKLITENHFLDTVFANSDLQYLRIQFKCYLKKVQKWNKNELKGVDMITLDKYTEIKGDEAYWEYSIPIFTKNSSMCIVKFAYICGDLCKSFSTILYKKTDQGWVEILEIEHGES